MAGHSCLSPDRESWLPPADAQLFGGHGYLLDGVEHLRLKRRPRGKISSILAGLTGRCGSKRYNVCIFCRVKNLWKRTSGDRKCRGATPKVNLVSI
jgi:hypothetical protein